MFAGSVVAARSSPKSRAALYTDFSLVAHFLIASGSLRRSCAIRLWVGKQASPRQVAQVRNDAFANGADELL